MAATTHLIPSDRVLDVILQLLAHRDGLIILVSTDPTYVICLPLPHCSYRH